MEPQFVRLDVVRALDLAAGVSGRPLFGEDAMLNLIRFEPGATVPLHSHSHEQLGIVVESMQTLVVDGTVYELGPFEAHVVPDGVEHSAYCGPDGALVRDVFTPGARGLPRALARRSRLTRQTAIIRVRAQGVPSRLTPQPSRAGRLRESRLHPRAGLRSEI